MAIPFLIQEFERTYKEIESLADWVVDEQTVLPLSAYYVIKEQVFSVETFNCLVELLQKRTGWLSPLRGKALPVFAAFLSDATCPTIDVIDHFFNKYQVVRKTGFRNTLSTYAACLLLAKEEVVYLDEIIRAKLAFEQWKQQHFFFISETDYVFAILAAKQENSIAIGEQVHLYYEALRKHHFHPCEQLQWMAQVLANEKPCFNRKIVKEVVASMHYFRPFFTIQPIHYPWLGLLAILRYERSQWDEIRQLTEQLLQRPVFSTQPEWAFILASGYVINQSIHAETLPIALPNLFNLYRFALLTSLILLPL